MDMINMMTLTLKKQKRMTSPMTEATTTHNKNDMELMQQLYKDDKVVADLLLDAGSANKSSTISYN